jgi:hypothetical protein
MTTREISEALGIPKGTADTRLRLAQEDFKAAFRRYEARARRETGRGSILPILGPLTLLEAEREIPRIPDELRARIWERLAHLDHGGGGGGGDGGGDGGGKGDVPLAKAAALSGSAVHLSATAALVAFGGVFGLGVLVGVLWSRPRAPAAPSTVPTLAVVTTAAPPSPSPWGAPSLAEDDAPPASMSPATPLPGAPAPFPDAHMERSLIVKAEGALGAGNAEAALAAAEEHAQLCRGGGALAFSREDVWIRALLAAHRAGEAEAHIERLARMAPDNPNLDTYRAAAAASR